MRSQPSFPVKAIARGSNRRIFSLKSPQSNEVDVDARGLVYLLDRDVGLDILEFQRG